MIEPVPGEPFEARGLRWAWSWAESGIWVAKLGESRVGIRLLRDATWRSVWDPDNLRHETADAAIAWAIRTCPGARCGSCNGIACPVRGGTPDDWYCDNWRSKEERLPEMDARDVFGQARRDG
jgi:hypothetical protein